MISEAKRNSIGSSAFSILLLTLMLFQFSKLTAQNNLPDSLVKERIVAIQKTLDQGKPAAKLWWNGWLYGYTAATVGQGVVFLASNKLKTRQDMALSAATTLIGAVGQLIAPMTPVSAPVKLALIPGETPEQRILKLNKAQELFEASAKREQEGRSWKMHVASGVVNAGSGLVTWLGFKRTVWDGLENFALNTAITEAQIWTQPMRASRDYKKYCEAYKYGLPYNSLNLKPRFYVNASLGGLAVRLVF